ncbi:MAG: DUF1559 domain-containing protein [Pirellulales bacterium]
MPVNFVCPHCGAQTVVADQFVGRTGACASCGQPITVHGSPGAAALAPPKSNTILLVVILAVALVVLLACAGLLVALLLPAVNAAREAGRKTQCRNNLRQIGLALHGYQTMHGCFPPAYIPDENGEPMHSWRVLILPFMGYEELYDQYDFDEPWDSPANMALADQMPSEFTCPTDPNALTNNTSYVAAVGPDRMFPGADARTPNDVADGLSNTIAVVEFSDSQINWLEPRDAPAAGELVAHGPPFSNHPGGWFALMADGSVRWVFDSTSAQDVDAMMTVDGGESVMMP